MTLVEHELCEAGDSLLFYAVKMPWPDGMGLLMLYGANPLQPETSSSDMMPLCYLEDRLGEDWRAAYALAILGHWPLNSFLDVKMTALWKNLTNHMHLDSC